MLTCEHRMLTCEHRMLTCENRLLTCENRLLTCENRLLACENRLLACENRNNIGKTYTSNGYIRQGVGGFWFFGVLSVFGRNSVNIGS